MVIFIVILSSDGINSTGFIYNFLPSSLFVVVNPVLGFSTVPAYSTTMSFAVRYSPGLVIAVTSINVVMAIVSLSCITFCLDLVSTKLHPDSNVLSVKLLFTLTTLAAVSCKTFPSVVEYTKLSLSQSKLKQISPMLLTF